MRVISAILSLAVSSNAIAAQVNTHQVEATVEKTVEKTVEATIANQTVQEVQALETNVSMTEQVIAEDIDVPLSDSANESVNDTALFEEEVRKDKLRLNEKHARRAKRSARRQSRFLEDSNNDTKLDPLGSLAEENVTLDLNETEIALDMDEEVRKDKARLSRRFHRQLLEENITDANATEFLEENATEFLDVNETEELEFKRAPRSAKRFARKSQRAMPMPRSQRSFGKIGGKSRGGHKSRASHGGRFRATSSLAQQGARMSRKSHGSRGGRTRATSSLAQRRKSRASHGGRFRATSSLAQRGAHMSRKSHSSRGGRTRATSSLAQRRKSRGSGGRFRATSSLAQRGARMSRKSHGSRGGRSRATSSLAQRRKSRGSHGGRFRATSSLAQRGARMSRKSHGSRGHRGSHHHHHRRR